MMLKVQCKFDENDYIIFGNIISKCMDITLNENGSKTQVMIKEEDALEIIQHLKASFNLKGD